MDLYGRRRYARVLNEVQRRMPGEGPLPPELAGFAAMAYLGLGRQEAAAHFARGAAQARPGTAWLLTVLAHAELEGGNTGAAIGAAHAAARLLPDDPGALALVARCMRAAGNAEGALTWARRAADAGAGHAEAQVELGLALQEQGDLDGALAAFRRAQAADPHDPLGFYHAGQLLLRQGRHGEGRRALRRALRADPDFTPAEHAWAHSVPLGFFWRHLMDLGRLDLVGLAMAAFAYYVAFRLLQMFSWAVPQTWPVSLALLKGLAVYLVAGVVVGRVLRGALRLVSSSVFV